MNCKSHVSKTADVTILGAGIVGALTAIQLKRDGVKCLLVDPDPPLTGASLNNAGGLYFQLQPDATTFSGVKPQSWRSMAKLISSARVPWERLQKNFKNSLGVTWSGGGIIALTKDQWGRLQEKQNWEKRFGIDSELLSALEVRRLLPNVSPLAVGASFSSTEGFCDTGVLAAFLRQQLRELGVQVIHGYFRRIESRGGGGYRIELTDEGIVSTEKVVCAMGAFSGQIITALGGRNVVNPLPLQVLEVQKPGVKLPLFTRYAGSKLSLKQLPSGKILIGGGWPAAVDPRSGELFLSLDSLSENLSLAETVIPALNGAKLLGSRLGRAAWTEDGLPIVGEYPSFPGVFFALGGNGFTLGPLYAETLAKLCRGEALRDGLEDFSPGRFLHSSEGLILTPDG